MNWQGWKKVQYLLKKYERQICEHNEAANPVEMKIEL